MWRGTQNRMLKENQQAECQPYLRAGNRYLTRLFLLNDGTSVSFSLSRNPSLNIKMGGNAIFFFVLFIYTVIMSILDFDSTF